MRYTSVNINLGYKISTFRFFMICYQICCRKLQKRQHCTIMENHKADMQNWIINWVKINTISIHALLYIRMYETIVIFNAQNLHIMIKLVFFDCSLWHKRTDRYENVPFIKSKM